MAPEVSETSVLLGLSHSLEILAHDGIHSVGDDLRELTVSWVLLSVEEPLGHGVISWSGNDITDTLDLVLSELTSSLVDVDVGDLHGQDGESAANASDLSQTERSLLLSVQVRVLHTQDCLEVVCVLKYQG